MATPVPALPRRPGRLRRAFESDLFYSFRRRPGVVVSALLVAAIVLSAVFAPLVAPHNPFDLKTLNLLDAFTPPAWTERGTANYLLGTDDQGRDVLSAIIYGSRMSLLVGVLGRLFDQFVDDREVLAQPQAGVHPVGDRGEPGLLQSLAQPLPYLLRRGSGQRNALPEVERLAQQRHLLRVGEERTHRVVLEGFDLLRRDTVPAAHGSMDVLSELTAVPRGDATIEQWPERRGHARGLL